MINSYPTGTVTGRSSKQGRVEPATKGWGIPQDGHLQAQTGRYISENLIEEWKTWQLSREKQNDNVKLI